MLAYIPYMDPMGYGFPALQIPTIWCELQGTGALTHKNHLAFGGRCEASDWTIYGSLWVFMAVVCIDSLIYLVGS